MMIFSELDSMLSIWDRIWNARGARSRFAKSTLVVLLTAALLLLSVGNDAVFASSKAKVTIRSTAAPSVFSDRLLAPQMIHCPVELVVTNNTREPFRSVRIEIASRDAGVIAYAGSTVHMHGANRSASLAITPLRWARIPKADDSLILTLPNISIGESTHVYFDVAYPKGTAFRRSVVTVRVIDDTQVRHSQTHRMNLLPR